MYFFIHKVKSPLFILSFIQYRFYQSSFTVLNKATGSKTPSVTEMEKKILGRNQAQSGKSKKESDNQPGFGLFKDFLHWFDNYVHLADLKKWWSSLNISLEIISFNSDAFVFHSEAFLFISY